MPTVIDLTLPIADHFRWSVERTLVGDYARGDQFQVTRVGWVVHGFTHVDAPVHIVPGAATTTDTPLTQTMGSAAVLDLRHVAPDDAITAEVLAAAGGHIRTGDIVLLKTCWEERVPIEDESFWRTAPYLTRDACEWLLEQGIKALGVDFPQDYPIRCLLDGEVRPIDEFVSHDVLLRNGVILIEYLCNLGALSGARTDIVCLPLKIEGADGAPARVIAIGGGLPGDAPA